MTIKPSQIDRISCLWKLSSGFDEWEDGASLLMNILDHLQSYYLEEMPTSISKETFIREAVVFKPRSVEFDLKRFEEEGYIRVEGDLIYFTEKFLQSWQKAYEVQEKHKKLRKVVIVSNTL